MANDAGSRMVQFGTNEWLVDEIYQQYLKDPQSVDRAWWDFFADYRAGEPGALPTPEPSTVPEHATSPGIGVVSSVPLAASTPPDRAAPERAGSAPAAPAATPGPNGNGSGTRTQPTPPVGSPPRPQLGHGVPAYEVEAPSGPVGQVTPQLSPSSILGAEEAAPEPAARVLRGPAARVVTNMEASLAVPTATSVRALPAKLLIDNRVIINNQLTRSRGGKVSFTHLIGYALVRALVDMPAMNVGFTVVNGKPAVLTHPMVNLGLAIDLAKPDGTRQLLVPSIKSADRMDFAAFWATYEELVRKARNGALGVDDFAGTTATLTNPGTIGTVHSVPRLMSGQGLIVGVGLAGLPGRVAGRRPRDPGPPGRQQDPDPDLHLRPPDHPGRAVRRVPGAGAPAAPRGGRLLRRHLHLPAHPVRADPVGDRHRHQPRLGPQQDRPGPGAHPRVPGARATSWPTSTHWTTSSASTPISTSPSTA